jgi:hypothetical protein
MDDYSDQHFALTAPSEIEDMKWRANKLGMLSSLAIFGLNEFTRLTMRTRKSLSC